MQFASDGSRIQYDQGKIQNLMLHGVNVNDPAELVSILANEQDLGTKTRFVSWPGCMLPLES